MATMIPSLDTINMMKPQPTAGESTLLKFLSTSLPDDYEVYFQPHLYGTFPDVVIMHKQRGVLIIEVKDYNPDLYQRINRDVWYVSNKNQEIRSPEAQVNVYKNLCFDLFIPDLAKEKALNKYKYSLIGTAVFLSEFSSKDIQNFYHGQNNGYTIVFGYDALNEQDFRRILGKNHLLSTSKYLVPSPNATNPSEKEFEIYSPLKRVLTPSKHSTEKLNLKNLIWSKDQKKIIKSTPGRKIKVRGVAGGGKTTVMSQLAINAYKRTKLPVLILTFNITLKNYIHDIINNLEPDINLENFTIMHYHQYIQIRKNLSEELYEEEHNNSKGEKFYYDPKKKHTLKKAITDKFSTILVDEIQDFEKEWVEVIYSLLKEGKNSEIVFFGDEKQNIYEREPESSKTQKPYTGITGNWNTLKQNFRSPNYIYLLATEFQKYYFKNKYEIDTPVQMDLLADQSSITYYYLNESTATRNYPYLNKIATIIKDTQKKFQLASDDIVVLGNYVEQLRELESYLNNNFQYKSCTTFESKDTFDKLFNKFITNTNSLSPAAITNNKKSLREQLFHIRRSKKFNFWMESGKIKLSTIHSFKGWQVDTVFLILAKHCTDNQNLPNTPPSPQSIQDKENLSEELLYTAITRAKNNLVIINLDDDVHHEFFKRKRAFPIEIIE